MYLIRIYLLIQDVFFKHAGSLIYIKLMYILGLLIQTHDLEMAQISLVEISEYLILVFEVNAI